MEWFIKTAKSIRPSTYAITFLSITILVTLLIINSSVLYGFYNLYDEITFPRNQKDSNIVVITGYSVAPFTSTIDTRSVEERLVNLTGVERVVYEVLSIASINDSTIIVRGVSRGDLEYLVDYSVIKGEDFQDDCMYCVWISPEIADKYGIDVGEYITINSLFTSSSFILQVKGVLELDKPYSYELIVPIDLARAIRGISDHHASLALVYLDKGVDKSIVLKRFNISSERLGLFERALIALKHSRGEISPHLYSSATEFYMARLGLQRNVFLAVSVSIMILLTIGAYIVGNMAVLVNRENLSILYTIGLSKRRIKLVATTILLVLVIASIPPSLFLSHYLLDVVGLEVMEYPLTSDTDHLSLFMTSLLTFIFTATGAYVVDIVEEE